MNSMYPKKQMTQARAANSLKRTPLPATPIAAQAPAKSAAKSGGRRIQVRQSGVHGRGVFTLKPIAKGEVLIEYKGDVITWKEALRRHPHDPSQPDHTFFFLSHR